MQILNPHDFRRVFSEPAVLLIDARVNTDEIRTRKVDRIAFGIQLSIALLLFCTLPLWKKLTAGRKRIPGRQQRCYL